MERSQKLAIVVLTAVAGIAVDDAVGNLGKQYLWAHSFGRSATIGNFKAQVTPPLFFVPSRSAPVRAIKEIGNWPDVSELEDVVTLSYHPGAYKVPPPTEASYCSAKCQIELFDRPYSSQSATCLRIVGATKLSAAATHRICIFEVQQAAIFLRYSGSKDGEPLFERVAAQIVPQIERYVAQTVHD